MARPLEPTVYFAIVLFSMPLGECRFGIESVNMTRPAIHEQKNHMLGFGGKMPWLGGELASERVVAAKQINQAQARKASARLPQNLTARLPTGRLIWNETGARAHLFDVIIPVSKYNVGQISSDIMRGFH